MDADSPPPSREQDRTGRSRLWCLFWLLGVLPSNALWAATLWAVARKQIPLTLALFMSLLLYTGWVIPAVWRAAPQARTPELGVAVRGLTVAWGLNTVLLVFFLSLQLANQ